LLRRYDDLQQIEYPDLDAVKKRIDDVLEALQATKIGICCYIETSPLLVYKAMRFEKY
jgi:hypothetical protein